MQEKYYKHNQITKADYVNNMTTEETTLYQHAQILAKEQYIQRHDSVCAQLHFNIRKELRVRLNNEHWKEHVPKLVQTSHKITETIPWNQQVNHS
jgi:hypothetical protein